MWVILGFSKCPLYRDEGCPLRGVPLYLISQSTKIDNKINVLLSCNALRSLSCILHSSYMFWATSSPPRVYRAVMDGSRVETIVSQGLINPVSLSIHNPGFNGIIYIMDSGHQSIFSYSLDGRQLGIAVANAPSSTGLAYDNTYLYYVKRTAQENMLYRVGKSDGSEHFKLISGLGNVRDMKYIKARQWLNRGLSSFLNNNYLVLSFSIPYRRFALSVSMSE